LHALMTQFVNERQLGRVSFSGIRVRLRPGMFRQPDLVYIAREHFGKIRKKFWTGIDLAVEVVSPGSRSRDRDYRQKRQDYAAGGVPEYWIVDPALKRITVLVLQGGEYRTHGEFGEGDQATSVTLTGFSADVAAVFAAAVFPGG